MEAFKICGGKKLYGEINISGAKNAAVAIIPAAIYADGPCTIENVPNISDVDIMLKVLIYMGAKVDRPEPGKIVIDCTGVDPDKLVPTCLSRRFRASYYLLGSLLGKYKRASVAMPGGCRFGNRPIDLHVKGFEALGATVIIEEHRHPCEACGLKCDFPEYKEEAEHCSDPDNSVVRVSAERLIGNQVYMNVVSVGATINVMLASVMAEGMTVIENAAREPHVVDLANFLNSMGADIRGAGTDIIRIYGVKEMHGSSYSIIPDQIEAGTYMVAAAAAGGDVVINNVIPKHLETITSLLKDGGVQVTSTGDSVRVVSEGGRVNAFRVKTRPHPGFPTDMQPQFGALLSTCTGEGKVVESVWDTRFQYIEQLRLMGAQIEIEDDTAYISGVPYLTGTRVRADDLRAGAAMVIAGLMAKGETEITNIVLIERGYENIVEKLTAVGADIKRV